MLHWMTTFATTPIWAAPTFHTKSVDLDGSSEYMKNANNNLIWIGNQWSIWFWVNADRASANEYIVNIKNSANAVNDIQILNRWPNNQIRFIVNDSTWTNFKVLNSTWSAPVWSIFYGLLTFDWTQAWDPLKFYRNWVEDTWMTWTDNTWWMSDTWRNVAVWVFVWGWNNFDWLVSRVDVWDTALPSAAATSLYDTWNGFQLDIRNSKWSYTQTANVKHQWALWKNLWSNIWEDFVSSWNINISNNSVNVSDADVVDFV